jgi:uncharacterized protein (TIGR00730 family)
MARITVFGGSQPKPGQPAYEEALHLGQLLASRGHTVLTGGYIGTMEAVSRGACEAGGHVIGVTCEDIEAWRHVKKNAWVVEELRYPTLRTRLYALIENCDAALALPGGPGTLAEIAMMWTHLVTASIPARPLVTIGPGWKATFETFFENLGSYTPPEQRRWLTFASSINEAVELLHAQLNNTRE